MNKKLEFNYDDYSDVITIEGIKYSGDLFRKFGFGLDLSSTFKIISREDGTITIETIYNNDLDCSLDEH